MQAILAALVVLVVPGGVAAAVDRVDIPPRRLAAPGSRMANSAYGAFDDIARCKRSAD